jgi:hypothetical protein
MKLFSKKNNKTKEKGKNLFFNSSKTIMLIYLKHYSEYIVSFFPSAHGIGYSDELAMLVEGGRKCKRRLVSRAAATEL